MSKPHHLALILALATLSTGCKPGAAGASTSGLPGPLASASNPSNLTGGSSGGPDLGNLVPDPNTVPLPSWRPTNDAPDLSKTNSFADLADAGPLVTGTQAPTPDTPSNSFADLAAAGPLVTGLTGQSQAEPTVFSRVRCPLVTCHGDGHQTDGGVETKEVALTAANLRRCARGQTLASGRPCPNE